MPTGLATLLTVLAFAGNSLLCRAALGADSIDPTSFTLLRLGSGALVLLPLLGRPCEDWAPGPAIALAGYALAFAFAFRGLDAGMGALLLFGTVQVTMIGAGLRRGRRLSRRELGGLLLACVGLLYLTRPGLQAPPPGHAALMVLAGIGWGTYSLAGHHQRPPSVATARNFALAAPLCLLALPLGTPSLSTRGALLAVVSGAGTSGLGYIVWYHALRSLDAPRAAIVQLLVPIVAALGGVLLLGESIGSRLVLGGGATLAGVATALTGGIPPRS